MKVLITYDVPAKHEELIKKMKARGYQKTILHPAGFIINLPNTAFYKAATNAKLALSDLNNSAKELSINVERCIAVEFNIPDGIAGKNY